MDQADDRKQSLLAVQSSCPSKSLISRLIAMQEYIVDQEKSVQFVQNLDCLFYGYPQYSSAGPRKRSAMFYRQQINAFQQRRFVALSYTWDPSKPYEHEKPCGAYHIAPAPKGRSSQPPVLRSPVRDRVFDRVTKYMRYKKVKYLWIDQHCIDQAEGPQKEIGMQAMDMVYGVSQHPIALLARPVRSEGELELLIRILSGALVQEHGQTGNFVLRCGPSTASKAFELLQGITNDLWWTRGWTFQENYRALPKMTLLMPHCSLLERQKCQARSRIGLGRLRGELCIASWIFHQEATKFCLAFEKRRSDLQSQAQEVLARAPKYTILLARRDKYGHKSTPTSMSPSIISDVSARGLKDVWDRLAIISNCCQYTVRIDGTSLKRHECSISLSILGLYLMNGELLSNHPDTAMQAEVVGRWTVEELIRRQSYQGYPASFLDPSSLTFNKGCRLFRAAITPLGMQASGYLWQIRRILPSAGFPQTLPWDDWPGHEAGNRLDLHTRRRLRQLADILYDCGEDSLPEDLDTFLRKEASVSRTKTFAIQWMRDMATCLAEAIDEGRVLYIAQLVTQAGHHKQPGGAVFFADATVSAEPRFVFTSFWPKKPEGKFNFNDLNRHMSLMVDCEGKSLNIPRLFTKEWIHGLCFYEACAPRKVVFPWPRSMMYL